MDELLPRDVVTNAIRKQMEADGTDHVWLSLEPIPKETILSHFPNICQRCLEEGYDVTKEWIPVVPAQHYFMGGIWVDSESRTTMDRLYAVGETSCNGVHGANRLGQQFPAGEPCVRQESRRRHETEAGRAVNEEHDRNSCR